MNTHHYDLQIRALVTKEDGEFVAHALELDLVGYGATEKAAMDELFRNDLGANFVRGAKRR